MDKKLVQILTDEEVEEQMKTISPNVLAALKVKKKIHDQINRNAEKIGKIPDADWMKKL